ncbi:MAG: methyltransferase domain-containing protein [Sphingobacteriales bacterium]|nr:methyltransferase domain-containing protein [Sphingobacteriales bacterium]
MKDWKIRVKEALNQVEKIVLASNHENDIQYFNFHQKRYQRMAEQLGTFDEGASVLNIGSHYLHTTLLFQFLGFRVDSIEVAEFWELEFVKNRAKEFKIHPILENHLETLTSLQQIEDKYDLILFTEILEHITFNPIHFWSQIYRISKPKGCIYISTPNAFCLPNIVRSFVRLLTLRGIGIPVNEIFRNVTYGHHWKEYAGSEIQRYFHQLSDDFSVKINKYHYRHHDGNGLMGLSNKIFAFIGNLSYVFADDIEAIVTIRKTGNWKLKSPEY